MTSGAQTEAACLLQSGALYRRRVGLVPISERAEMVFAGFKRGAFSLYFGDAPIYHFDLEGRWQRAYLEPTHYLKSLDTRVQMIDRVREGPTSCSSGGISRRIRSSASTSRFAASPWA